MSLVPSIQKFREHQEGILGTESETRKLLGKKDRIGAEVVLLRGRAHGRLKLLGEAWSILR